MNENPVSGSARLQPSRPDADGLLAPPEEVAARYRRLGYWRHDRLDQLVWATMTAKPEATALVGGDRRLSYRELGAWAEDAADVLASNGVGTGTRTLLQMTNSTGLVVTLLALLRTGAVPVMVLPALGEREVQHVAAATSVTAAVVDTDRRDRTLRMMHGIRRSLGECWPILAWGPGGLRGDASQAATSGNGDRPRRDRAGRDRAGRDRAGRDRSADRAGRDRAADRVALYLLSGGTTGLPKPIPRTHRDYAYNLRISAEHSGLDNSSVYLATIPVTHNFALGCPGVLGTLVAGGTVVVTASPASETVCRLIEEERVTITAAVPGTAMAWARAAGTGRWDLSSLRVLQVGGARLFADPARRIADGLGCQIQQVFGMAEGLLNFTRLDDPAEITYTTQGRPASPGDEWRIVDSDGRDVPPGQPGELLARGPYTIRAYLAEDAVNAASFTADGYYRTGDIVRLHPSGNFVVVGRTRDFINRGGEKFSEHEVEELLVSHPGINACAVVGMPDEHLGERVCAYLVPAPGAQVSLDDVRGHLARQGLARFKLPEHLVVVDSIPVTAAGKTDRVALRTDIARRGRTDRRQDSANEGT